MHLLRWEDGIQRFFAVLAAAALISATFAGVTPLAYAQAPTPISECMTISESGAYVLADNIGTTTTHCLIIATSSVSISNGEGYTITGTTTGDYYGVRSAGGYSDITLTGLSIHDFRRGISLEGVTDALVEDVNIAWGGGEIAGSVYGVFAGNGSEDVTIGTSTIAGPGGAGYNSYGVRIDAATTTAVTNITASDLDYGMTLSNLAGTNLVSHNIITAPDNVGMLLEYVENLTVTENQISDNDDGNGFAGIVLFQATSTVISSTTISTADENDGIGIEADYSNGLTVSDNDITRFYYGMHIYGSSDVTITDNTITDPYDAAIILEAETDANADATVTGNIIYGPTDDDDYGEAIGVREMGGAITISENEIYDAYNDGLVVEGTTTTAFVEISGNHIEAHGDGMDVWDLPEYVIEGNTIISGESSIIIEDSGFRQLASASDDSDGWISTTTDLSAYAGQVITLYLYFASDSSVASDGVLLDDIVIEADGSPIFTDDVESGTNGWTITTPSGPAWKRVTSGAEGVSDVTNEAFPSGSYAWFASWEDDQMTALSRTVDLTDAETAELHFDIAYDTEEGYDQFYVAVTTEDSLSTITGNDLTSDGEEGEAALDIYGAHQTLISQNLTRADKWVAASSSLGPAFADGTKGNRYYFADGTPSWEVYDIRDTNGDHWADIGANLPFSAALSSNDGTAFYRSVWNLDSDGDWEDGDFDDFFDNNESTGRAPTSTATSSLELTYLFDDDETFENLKWHVVTDADEGAVAIPEACLADTGGKWGFDVYFLADADAGTVVASCYNYELDDNSYLTLDTLTGSARVVEIFLSYDSEFAPWTGIGRDRHPYTLTTGTAESSRRPSGSYVNRTTPPISTDGSIPDVIRNIILNNRALFLQAHSLGIVLPDFILQLLGLAPTGEVRDLTLNMEGSDVTALQTLLIAQGYPIPAGATGFFGPQTQSALAAYQAANGISPAIGYFGPITRAQMKAANLPGLWW